MRKSSETDWDRVDSLTDERIDTSDIPPLAKSFFSSARLRMPEADVAVTVHLDRETYAWFRALGRDREARMQAALRLYAQSHRLAGV